MSGHVFVTRGDITKLACDAWLLPTDATLHVTSGFRRGLTDAHGKQSLSLPSQLPEDWSNVGRRVIPLTPTPTDDPPPVPWLVNVGSHRGESVEWYLEGVRQFFVAVRESLAVRTPRNKRQVPLVALPVVGTGDGGASDNKGEVLVALLEIMAEEAARGDIDLVLVTHEESMFAAAQWARKQLQARHAVTGRQVFWPALDDKAVERAAELARHARNGNLVLFLGAGVSAGAGLLTWRELLDRLARAVEFSEPDRQALARLSILDQAEIVENRYRGKEPKIGPAIAKQFEAKRFSLAHSLLATLPVSEAVTTNYDTLFEMAAEAAGNPVAVLPYERPTATRRWLLKMHGCVLHPDDIVLTRKDYLGYGERRAALAGIVQALLVTRHMLFVGFSLSDDNFHRIVHDVRKAIGTSTGTATEPARYGTALLLERDQFLEQLWSNDLHCVGMVEPDVTKTADEILPVAARMLEQFLDLVVSEATTSSAHLLDGDFLSMLSEPEAQLKTALESFVQSVPDGARLAPAWRIIENTLASLGYRHE